MQTAFDITCGTDEVTSSVFKHWVRYPIDDRRAVRMWLTNHFGPPLHPQDDEALVADNRKWTFGLSYVWFKSLSDRTFFMLHWS